MKKVNRGEEMVRNFIRAVASDENTPQFAFYYDLSENDIFLTWDNNFFNEIDELSCFFS